MVQIDALIYSFGLVALAELGDKTQIALFSLTAKYKQKTPIFLGVALAFALVDGLAVLFGHAISSIISEKIIELVASVAFIAFGIYFYYEKEENNELKERRGMSLFLSSFLLLTLMEMGDKTQLLTATLAAKYSSPLFVFAGAWCALMLLSLLAIIAGAKIAKKIPQHNIRKLSATLFILIGLLGLIRIA